MAIAAWIDTLSPSYPLVPLVNVKDANVSNGAALFALNCAACHTIEGDGDALANGTFAPSLRHIPATQVAEAIDGGAVWQHGFRVGFASATDGIETFESEAEGIDAAMAA